MLVPEDKLAEAQFPKKTRDTLFRTKHDLILPAYRALDEEARKEVDSVLDIKPAGLPGLDLIFPKV